MGFVEIENMGKKALEQFVVTGENFTDFVQSFSRNDDFCAFIFIF